MSSYPVAYRNQSAVQQRNPYGSQGGSNPNTPANDNARPPKPANDNNRPMKPANDNAPGGEQRKAISPNDAYRLLRPVLRFALRRVLWPLDLLDIMMRILRPPERNPITEGFNLDGWDKGCLLVGGGMANRNYCGFNLTLSNAQMAADMGGIFSNGRWRIGFLENIRPHPSSPDTHKRVDVRLTISRLGTAGNRQFVSPRYQPALPTPWLPPLPRPIDPFVPPQQPDPDPNGEKLPVTVSGALKVPNRFSPTERTFRGRNRLYPRIIPQYPYEPPIVIEVNPDAPTKKPPVGRSDPDPNKPPVVRIHPRHELKRPGRREREIKKRTTRAGFQALNKGIGQLTEGLDLIDVLYDALPEKIRKAEKAKTRAYWKNHNSLFKSRDPSVRRKLDVLRKHWKEMDNAELAKGFIKEQLQDAVFGRIGRKAGEAGRAMGRPVGVGAGPVF